MSKIHDWAAAVVGASCRAATGDTLLRAYAVAPMPSVALDARDAHVPPLRGWGRYVHELLTALRAIGAPVRALEGPWPGPEVVWEQLRLPWHALRRRAGVLHAPNCFLPLVRPCAGVVTVHDLAFEDHPGDFARATGLKYRTWTPRAARSAQIVITPSAFTRDDVVQRYGVDASKIRVIA